MILQTERLELRPFEPGDLDAFTAINADPEVMRYFTERKSHAETADWLARIAEHWARFSYGWGAAVERQSGRLIGMIGLSSVHQDLPFAPAVQVGWRLSRDAWGHGFATEGARALVEYGFQTLNAPEIVAFTVTDNAPSRRVMERLGMRRDTNDDFDHPAIEIDHPLRRHVLYRLKPA